MKETVLLKDKYLLTINEATAYFGIGDRKLRQIANDNLDTGLVIQNGVKILFNRKKFEEYLDKVTVI